MDDEEFYDTFLEQSAVEIKLNRALARRVVAWVERFNAENDPEDHFDLTKLSDWQLALAVLVETGCEADEKEKGFVGMIDGRVMKDTPELREQMRQGRERMKAMRENRSEA